MQFLMVSVILIIVGIIWAIAGIAIGIRFYNNVRHEVHKEKGKVIQKIMKAYALIQCVGWPMLMILAWLLYVNKFVSTFLRSDATRNVIISCRFVYTIFRIYVSFNSLIIAICRYSFIVYEKQVITFGFNRVRSILQSSSVVVPIVLAFSNEVTNQIEITWSCLFMPQANKNHQPDYDNITYIFCANKQVEDINESMIYNIFNRYLTPSVTEGLKIFHTVMVVTIGSNVLEGLMYLHIFAYIRRYETMINKLLN